VDFTLANCLKSGLGHVALLTQYRHHDLHGYIRDHWCDFWKMRYGEPLFCLPPTSGKRYRGTADSVFHNLAVIESNRPEYVLILSGDHVYDMDYRELLSRHVETNADVTIATIEYPVKDAGYFGVIEADSGFRVTGFQEKPPNPRGLPLRPHMALVSMGIYLFKRDVLIQSLIENCDRMCGYDFGHHVIPSLIGSGRIYAYNFRDDASEAPRYWRDIGTIDNYYGASMDFARPDPPFDLFITLDRLRPGGSKTLTNQELRP
jgi:glucose-1-phosphate adenylyltransferase